ncbi:lysophospholipid acyltransferase 1 isoform X2 [Hypanus sabinus]|uniref:lysophospholipid acyltransferase 1 isoform X2 n=1 Tax=Hypanus sabinus TaxID=79690 RepID=UPI0028C3823B|nr:lysophospholipid acyltransferase 1 isoform X2 [Hypanus sabinus]
MAEQPSIPFRTTGSRVLHPLSVFLSVPLDQVNFTVCQLFALFAAFWFRLYLSPNRAGAVVRHVVITIFGIYFAIFCFGWYSLHIFIEVSLCYVIMTKASISNIHRPLMIVTQKITSLAFQIHDGMGCKDEELTTEQRNLAVSTRPTFLEYCSYHLNFLGILAGPTSNFRDYIAFIEGTHINMKLIEEQWKQRGYTKFPDPSPFKAVANKIIITIFCMVWFMGITKNFPISYNVDDKFVRETSFFWRLCYLFISVHASRPKYYFAWTLADAVNNAAGFGFNGLDKNGNLRWDLISNLNIWNIETATSFKMCLDNWNIQTGAWLKSVCYNRAPYFPTALTFVLSALWHGVYPGYYFTFVTAIPITLAARVMRSNFRHYFLSSKKMKVVYDIITWTSTQMALCYIVTPFLLLATEPTIKFYKSMYFHFHILCALVLPVLTIRKWKVVEKIAKTDPSSSNANSSLAASICQPSKKKQ